MTTKIDRFSSVGIIGAGRLGCSLALALKENNYNLTAVFSRNTTVKKTIRKFDSLIKLTSSPQEVVEFSDIIFITSNDDNVSKLANSLSLTSKKSLLHCSGSLSLDVLLGNHDTKIRVGSFHPMQTFPNITSSKNFKNIFFCIDSTDDFLETWLEQLAGALRSQVIKIHSNDRDLYHAICILNCGLISSLIAHSSKLWAHIGIDSEIGLQATLPMLKTTLDSISKFGSLESITGPLIRGDTKTIKRHLQVLDKYSKDSKKLYMYLSALTIDVGKSRFNFSDAKLHEIRQILDLDSK